MYCTLSFNCALVQTLPTGQATLALTDILRGVMTLHSRLYGQASNDYWMDFFECHCHISTAFFISGIVDVRVWVRFDLLARYCSAVCLCFIS